MQFYPKKRDLQGQFQGFAPSFPQVFKSFLRLCFWWFKLNKHHSNKAKGTLFIEHWLGKPLKIRIPASAKTFEASFQALVIKIKSYLRESIQGLWQILNLITEY